VPAIVKELIGSGATIAVAAREEPKVCRLSAGGRFRLLTQNPPDIPITCGSNLLALPILIPILEARSRAHDGELRRMKRPLRAAAPGSDLRWRRALQGEGAYPPCEGATLQPSGGAIGPKAAAASRSQCTHSAAWSFARSGACSVKRWRQNPCERFGSGPRSSLNTEVRPQAVLAAGTPTMSAI